MFALATLKHTVKISPQNFDKDFVSMLIDELNKNFANYVIPDVGLCITFYSFKKVGSSFILPGDASTHTPVIFRYIVFQPFVGEVLEGTILRSSAEGLVITMQFFSDIIVPPDKLPDPSKFDETVQVWSWQYSTDDETVTPFFMETGKPVRFKVSSITYQNIEPGTPAEVAKPMWIKASMFESGLGVTSWWAAPKQELVEGEGMDEDE